MISFEVWRSLVWAYFLILALSSLRRAFACICTRDTTHFWQILCRLCCIPRVTSTNAALWVVRGKALRLHTELINLFLSGGISWVSWMMRSWCTHFRRVSRPWVKHIWPTWGNSGPLRNFHSTSKRVLSFLQLHIPRWSNLFGRLRHVAFVIVVLTFTTCFWCFWAHLLWGRRVRCLSSKSLS